MAVMTSPSNLTFDWVKTREGSLWHSHPSCQTWDGWLAKNKRWRHRLANQSNQSTIKSIITYTQYVYIYTYIYTIIHHHTSSYIIIYYHILSYISIYYHILSHIITYYHILSHIIIYYHILSYIIIYYHILSYIIIYYHILSYTYPSSTRKFPIFPIDKWLSC